LLLVAEPPRRHHAFGRRLLSPAGRTVACASDAWRRGRQKCNTCETKGGPRAAFFICDGPKQNLAEVSRPAMSRGRLVPLRLERRFRPTNFTARDIMHF